jgi:hypothetical protein
MVHKALNPIHPALMGPLASKSSISRAFLDALDASGGATFVRLFSRRREPDEPASCPRHLSGITHEHLAPGVQLLSPRPFCPKVEPSRRPWAGLASDRRSDRGPALSWLAFDRHCSSRKARGTEHRPTGALLVPSRPELGRSRDARISRKARAVPTPEEQSGRVALRLPVLSQ